MVLAATQEAAFITADTDILTAHTTTTAHSMSHRGIAKLNQNCTKLANYQILNNNHPVKKEHRQVSRLVIGLWFRIDHNAQIHVPSVTIRTRSRFTIFLNKAYLPV